MLRSGCSVLHGVNNNKKKFYNMCKKVMLKLKYTIVIWDFVSYFCWGEEFPTPLNSTNFSIILALFLFTKLFHKLFTCRSKLVNGQICNQRQSNQYFLHWPKMLKYFMLLIKQLFFLTSLSFLTHIICFYNLFFNHAKIYKLHN